MAGLPSRWWVGARGYDGPDSDDDFLATFAPGATLFDVGSLLGGKLGILGASGVTANHGGGLTEAIPL